MENFGVLHPRFAFTLLFWYIKWPFGTFAAILVHFSQFFFCTKKNLATLLYIDPGVHLLFRVQLLRKEEDGIRGQEIRKAVPARRSGSR
jgi:hypothetical protein